MEKHSPHIALVNAHAELEWARQTCPHWDYESEGDSGEECCYRVDDARRALTAARKRAEVTS